MSRLDSHRFSYLCVQRTIKDIRQDRFRWDINFRRRTDKRNSGFQFFCRAEKREEKSCDVTSTEQEKNWQARNKAKFGFNSGDLLLSYLHRIDRVHQRVFHDASEGTSSHMFSYIICRKRLVIVNIHFSEFLLLCNLINYRAFQHIHGFYF